MSSSMTHVDGSMEPFRAEAMSGLLGELESADVEYTDVSVQHEDGLSLSVFRSGLVVVEDIEAGTIGPLWTETSDQAVVLDLMSTVASGTFTLEDSNMTWTAGYGPPPQ